MSKQGKAYPAAFTLVELLVVVTIIVVLLALLVPAMDKAIYQAELALCATNLKAVATGGTMYAMENRRYYPHMYPKHADRPNRSQPSDLRNTLTDWRSQLRGHFPLNKMLNCPLNADVDYESGDLLTQDIWSDYNLYYGWQYYDPNPNDALSRINETPMSKLGDRFGFTQWTGQNWKFSVVAADRDLVMPGETESQSSHPDRHGVMSLVVVQDAQAPWGQVKSTISLWFNANEHRRGDIDQNFASDDGSVRSMKDVKHDEPRLVKVPIWADKDMLPPYAYSQLPQD